MKKLSRACMRFCLFLAFFGAVLSPVSASAANLEVSGWIPYWHDSAGLRDATRHITNLDQILPFVYSVQEDGSIKDVADVTEQAWQDFLTQAKKRNVKVLPTVMWSDADAVNVILSDSDTRKKHIEDIVALVTDGGYDGVDIDYENKHASTRDAYSAFLKELKQKLGHKILSCAVEPRTPADSLYAVIPDDLQYANDYSVIGTYCDRVEIMGYDQQRADIKLNKARQGRPYIPVADIEWVKKVVNETMKTIPKNKIILGIPTYGYHYAITVAPAWYRDYTRIGALNLPDIRDIAREYKVKPSKNKAGEMGFTYIPKSANFSFPKDLKIESTDSGNKVAAQALAYANKTGKEVTFNIVSYEDASSIKQKIDLAKSMGLRGVALFKIDGEEDQKVWAYLK